MCHDSNRKERQKGGRAAGGNDSRGIGSRRGANQNRQTRLPEGCGCRYPVSEKEIGLPIYPGAKPHKDSQADSPGANIGLWGNSFGFKLVVLKMETPDAPAKVAAFYQKALAKYGKVLDCTNPPAKPDAQGTKKTSSAVTCDDTPETGAMLFKSGTRGKQHIVGIEPNGQGSVFRMVLLDTRGIDTDEHPL